ncbi:his-70 [Symbiodinium sp. CCMP2592]|nr:his-70 [Symbiodinium sp. CCMP2592]
MARSKLVKAAATKQADKSKPKAKASARRGAATPVPEQLAEQQDVESKAAPLAEQQDESMAEPLAEQQDFESMDLEQIFDEVGGMPVPGPRAGRDILVLLSGQLPLRTIARTFAQVQQRVADQIGLNVEDVLLYSLDRVEVTSTSIAEAYGNSTRIVLLACTPREIRYKRFGEVIRAAGLPPNWLQDNAENGIVAKDTFCQQLRLILAMCCCVRWIKARDYLLFLQQHIPAWWDKCFGLGESRTTAVSRDRTPHAPRSPPELANTDISDFCNDLSTDHGHGIRISAIETLCNEVLECAVVQTGLHEGPSICSPVLLRLTTGFEVTCLEPPETLSSGIVRRKVRCGELSGYVTILSCFGTQYFRPSWPFFEAPLEPVLARAKLRAARKEEDKAINTALNITSEELAMDLPADEELRKTIRVASVMRTIQKLQSSKTADQLLIPKSAFAAVVREIGEGLMENVRFSTDSLNALQTAAEWHLVDHLADTSALAHHARRVTVMPKDFAMLRHLHRD